MQQIDQWNSAINEKYAFSNGRDQNATWPTEQFWRSKFGIFGRSDFEPNS